MKTPADGWDHDEQPIPDALARDLDTAGPRRGQPSLEALRAAGEDVLPRELDAAAQWHLAQHPGTRVLVDALNDSAALDADAQARLFARITQQTQTIARDSRPASRRWQIAAAIGTIVIMGAALWMTQRANPVTPTASSTAAVQAPPQVPAAPATPTFLIPLERPDVKISLRSMTWRGQGPANPVLVALKPALDAFREGDYLAADREFSIVSKRFPDLVEGALYQGVSRLFLNDWSGATASLTRAQQINDPAFAADIAWYLAIAEERSGDSSAAQRRLRLSCERDHSPRACHIVTDTK